MFPLQRRYQNIRRYRDIARVLLRHGFGSLVDLLGLPTFLGLPRWLLGRPPGGVQRLTVGERVRMALEELGPTFIKLGQILSTRPDLVPPDLVPELVRLQDEVPAAPWDDIQDVIETDLGRSVKALFYYVDPKPLAAASLGQVHAAELHSGEQVVVKVQRPGIEHIIQVDLQILNDLATLAEQRTSLGQIYDLRVIAEDFADTLRSELDYRREGRNADRFREKLADEPNIRFPKVYWDYSSRRVLTLERMDGIKIDDFSALDAAGHNRKVIARHATRIMFRQVYELGFFHADPHPGNFSIQEDGAIAVVDFGMVGHLSDADQLQLGRLFVSALRRDAHAMVDDLIRMNSVSRGVDRQALSRDLDRLLDKYQDLSLGEMSAQELLEDILPVAFRHRIRLPSQYWLLGKTLAMMEGLLVRLDPDFEVFQSSKPHMARLAARLNSPEAILERAATGVSHWAALAQSLPEIIPRLLDKAEAGRLELQFHTPELARAVHQLDRIANRLAVSILVASFIVALALLMPAFAPQGLMGLGGWVILLGFLAVSAMGLWLLYHIWRSGRGR